jgi:hypothetical protein
VAARHRHRPHFAAPGRTCAIGTALALALSSCASPATGRAALPPETLLKDAQAAVAQEGAVHLAGTVSSTNGKATDKIVVNSVGNSSDTAAGTFEVSGPGMGFVGKTQYILIGTTIYVNGDSAFWSSLFHGAPPGEAPALMPKVVDKWVQLSGQAAATLNDDVLGLALPSNWLSKSLDLASAAGQVTLSNDGRQSLEGKRGIQVSASTGAKVLIASSGAPLPLAFTATTTKKSITFTLGLTVAFSAPSKITAPRNSQQLQILQSEYFNSQG